MDEYNITQTTKNDQVFFSKISNQKYYTHVARRSEYAKLNKKLSEKDFSLDFC